VILTAHATKVNRTEPNRVWPVKIAPLIYAFHGNSFSSAVTY